MDCLDAASDPIQFFASSFEAESESHHSLTSSCVPSPCLATPRTSEKGWLVRDARTYQTSAHSADCVRTPAAWVTPFMAQPVLVALRPLEFFPPLSF